jgi:hypothetical protein
MRPRPPELVVPRPIGVHSTSAKRKQDHVFEFAEVIALD